ncbi:MAG TPA: DUF6787 family protein [Acidobacteriota bacterium]|nr:DUF6787 family protein [Acidobacteriota bacterium]
MGQAGWIDKMKARWGVGPLDVVAILASFSLAGMSVLLVGRPILAWALPEDAPTWLRVVAYMLLIFPLYQVLLLSWGALLGQFGFFWEREKKLGRLLLRLTGGPQSRSGDQS